MKTFTSTKTKIRPNSKETIYILLNQAKQKDKNMMKTNKTNLGKKLKKTASKETELPLDCVSIFDGMVLFLNIPKHCSTFGEISNYFLMKILSSILKIL